MESVWPLAGVAWFLVASVTTLAAVLFVHWFGLLDLWLNPVDRSSQRYGGEHVAAVLKAHGVKFVFTLCGGHISPILAACEKDGIRIVDTRHEVTCVFAADAVARLSGVIGVACVTAGPGVTNTITAVKNAAMAESPVLLMGGAAAGIIKGRGSLQDIDQMTLFKPLCKFTASIKHIRDIVPTMRRAIQVAQSGTPGPVFVEFPIDVLYRYELISKELLPKTEVKSFGQKITNWYLTNYVDRVFVGAWKKQDLTPLPITFPRATSSEIERSVSLLRFAKKPVFLIGSQATLPPMKVDDVRAALEKLGIPCFLGGMARGLLGQNSPIHIRQRRRDALKEADVVVCAGAVADFRLSYGRVFSRRSKIISINRTKSNVTLNADIFWKPQVAITGDPGCFVVDLAQALGDGYKCSEEWPASLKERDEEKEAANMEKGKLPASQHLNPVSVLHQVEEIMSDKAILVADGGDFVGTAAYILRPRGPLKWLDPGAFGTLGVGGGFALGAKLCNPDADVWIIYGDGSLGYSVAEFDTFTRHSIPVIALVGNDACWTQIAREQVLMLGTSVGCMLSYCDYEEVARGYGGAGVKLDSDKSAEEIKAELEKAQRLSRSGKPVLINCLIGKTDFRDGSISV